MRGVRKLLRAIGTLATIFETNPAGASQVIRLVAVLGRVLVAVAFVLKA